MQFFKFRVLNDNLVIYEKEHLFADVLSAQVFIGNKFPNRNETIVIFGANSEHIADRTKGIWYD